MKTEDDELQDRVCRACQQTYRYPAMKSTATRFYCEGCMDLPPEVRATFERFNKRLTQLAAEVQKLHRRSPSAPGEGGPVSPQ